MRITKDNNQYYAQYLEEAVNSIINNLPIVNNTGHRFSPADIATMNRCAKNLAKIIGGKTSVYIGRKTASERGDLLIDMLYHELKMVGSNSSTATYFNTDMNYFVKTFGLKSYREFMIEYGVYDYLEILFGPSVYKNISPVSQEDSSIFQKTHPKEYKKLTKIEASARAAYTKYVFEFLNGNEERLKRFIRDMFGRNNNKEKGMPDFIYIYNYKTNQVRKITKNDLEKMAKEALSSFRIGGKYSLVFKTFRATLGWQNGTGLCNPTIRVFLK